MLGIEARGRLDIFFGVMLGRCGEELVAVLDRCGSWYGLSLVLVVYAESRSKD